MSSSACDTNREAECFSYKSLDLSQRSIRLLWIYPHVSSSGHVRCEMRDATVDDDYTCLSYVWGQPDDGYSVAINGQLHRVRQNLFSFLERARKKHFGWLWIDALCIDQGNFRERTHQVQQMGDIYSQAVQVVSWLGASPDIVDLFRQISNRSFVTSDQVNLQMFYANNYWTRAWVTQEILLARRLTLLVDEEELPMKRFPRHLGLDMVDRNHVLSSLQLRDLNPEHYRNQSLVYLLDAFCAQECEVPHDRVFSLLALCRESSDLKVDYEVSVEELLWRICNCCAFCFCSLKIASYALLGDNNKPRSNHQPTSSSGLLRMCQAEVRDKKVDRRGGNIFLGFSPVDVSRFTRKNEALLDKNKKAAYKTSYFIPMSLICSRYDFGTKWFLAVCVRSERAGFDYYHVPETWAYRVEESALGLGIQHWPDSLEVTYDKCGLCTIRVSLAFWVELSRSEVCAEGSGLGQCRYATGEQVGMKLSAR